MGDLKERKIPVLTVQKNGTILKNIFVLNSPILPPSSPPSVSQSSLIQNPNNNNNKEIKQEEEEVVIVGRHPDCNIVLTHPSVSRFHLQINSIPFLHKLSLTDLGSVHGTWVSGNRIVPGVPVELAKGDTFRIGASTRVYRLHWVPLSCAYDTEGSFVSALDMTISEDQTSMEENTMSTEFKHAGEKIPLMAKTCLEQNNFPVEKDVLQDETENSLSVENHNLGKNNALIAARDQGGMSKVVHSDNSLSLKCEEIQQLDSLLDGLNSLFSDDYAGSVRMEEIRLVPPVPKNMKTTTCDEREEGKKLQYDHEATEKQPLISPFHYDKSNMINDCNVISYCSRIMNSLFSDESSDSVVRRVILSAHPMPEDLRTPISNEKEEDQLFQSDDKAGELQPVMSPLPAGEALLKKKCVDESFPPLTALQLSCEEGNRDLLAERSMKELMNLDFAQYSENDIHLAEEVLEEHETWSLSRKDYSPCKMSTLSSLLLPTTESVNSSNPVSELLSENADHKESQTPQSKIENLQGSVKLQERSALGSIWSRRGKLPSAIQIQTDKSRRKTREDHAFVGAEEKGQDTAENRSIALRLFFGVKGTEHEVYTPDKENIFLNTRLFKSQKKSSTSRRKTRGDNARVGVEVKIKENFESRSTARPLFSNVEGAEDEVYTPDKENFSPNTPLLRSLKRSGNMENFENRSTTQPLFSNVEGAGDKVYIQDKENFSLNTRLLRSLKKSGKLGAMKNTMSSKLSPKSVTATFSMQPNENKENFRQEEGLREGLYTSDKENFSPHTLLTKSMRKNVELGESKRSSKFSYSNGILSPSFQPELVSSDKENHTSKAIQPKSVKPALENQMKLEPQIMERKEKAIERVPFQPLLENSASKSRPEASVTSATGSDNFIHRRQSSETKITRSLTKNNNEDTRKGWTMLVDASSLINKESRKSLQLLQGLKGTKLLIPRMVIRELDGLKRQSSFFRRKTEVSSALDWIEECMVETNWWIHVQTSLEEGRSIAPTPPATPRSEFSDETGWFSNRLCPTHVSLMEVATPTTQDHILDYALLFRRMMKDGQLVLLSNDITLKIKAMAEGLLCETAQEFQESLLNPFSERFLWTDSSPRGQTWSHLDDVVLREKYNHFPLRKSFKGEGAKGLKLILLHNSQYGKKTLAC